MSGKQRIWVLSKYCMKSICISLKNFTMFFGFYVIFLQFGQDLYSCFLGEFNTSLPVLRGGENLFFTFPTGRVASLLSFPPPPCESLATEKRSMNIHQSQVLERLQVFLHTNPFSATRQVTCTESFCHAASVFRKRKL